MTRLIAAIDRELVERAGWRPGTSLENRVALHLIRLNALPCEQQYRVGRYRLDFAWPALRIALEADGWHHRSPDMAARDAARDAWLRARGWLVLRVDDDDRTLRFQLARICRLVRSEVGAGWVWPVSR